jgi:hypothetical protein
MCRHFGAEPSKVLVVGSPLLLRWPLYCQTKRCHRRHAGGTEFRKRCLSLLFARAGGHVPWSSWIDGISFPICLRAFRKMPASQIGGESGPVSLNRMRVRVKQKSILCQSLCLSSRRRGSLERGINRTVTSICKYRRSTSSKEDEGFLLSGSTSSTIGGWAQKVSESDLRLAFLTTH